jgi:eukaryotic-like serine/threonine-protein kinase
MEPAGQRPVPTPKSPPGKKAVLPELRTLGRYVIDKKLGSGGMGAVYRATDSKLKRVVALKVLPRDKAENPTLVRRFQSEAQAAANLKHENIIGVYDSGEIDGYLYIAMEFVDGIDVGELVLKKGILSAKRSMDIMQQVAMALQHAFEQNIVHRDIKPANLMIDRDGNVKLADMGLARSLGEEEEEEASITRAGTTVGTVDYMSPEQARDSKSADCRSDIYSLGATWFHMLTGRPPFVDGDLLNKIHAHANDAPPDPRTLNPDIPDAIVEIINRMLAKKKADRYQSPAELLEDLTGANLKKREITSDLLAALAEDDEESQPRKPQRPRQKKKATREKPTGSRSERRTAAISSGSEGTDDESTRRPPKAETPLRSRAISDSDDDRESAVHLGAMLDDEDSTEAAIPSARDIALSRYRGGRSRNRPKGRPKGAGIDQARLLQIGGGIVILLIVAWLGSSMFGGGGSSTTLPATPTLNSPADTGTVRSTSPSPEAGLSIPDGRPSGRPQPRRLSE